MNTISKWIEVGKILAVDPRALVDCPECNKKYLKIDDIICDADLSIIERKISCTCGAHNYLRLNRQNESKKEF